MCLLTFIYIFAIINTRNLPQQPEIEMKTFFATQGGGSVFWDRILQKWIFEEPPAPIFGLAAGDPMPEEWGIGGFVGYDKQTQEELAWEEHSFADKEYEEELAWSQLKV